MTVEDTWFLKDEVTRSKRYGRGLRYRVRWRDAPTRSFRTKGEAERHWLRVRTEKPPAEVSDATVDELVERWLKTKRGLSKKGYESCRDAAKHVRGEFGARTAAEVSAVEVETWLAGLTVIIRRRTLGDIERRASVAVKKKALQCIAGSMRVGGLAFGSVPLPKESRRDARYLTMAELHQLALAAGEWLAMVLLLGTTGLRIGEAAALNVGSVDVRRRRVRVATSKNGEGRDVPVSRSLLARLDLDRASGEPLFLSPNGMRVHVRNWRRRAFTPAVTAAGLAPLRIHDLRHTAASLAIAAGADVKAVQRMLGHKSAAMTLDLYGHLFDRRLDDVADALDAAFREVVPGTTADGGE